MTPTPEQDREPTYWICDDCAAKEKDWKLPDRNVTVIRGLCGHCDRKDEVFLTPVVDYDRPGKKAVWD